MLHLDNFAQLDIMFVVLLLQFLPKMKQFEKRKYLLITTSFSIFQKRKNYFVHSLGVTFAKDSWFHSEIRLHYIFQWNILQIEKRVCFFLFVCQLICGPKLRCHHLHNVYMCGVLDSLAKSRLESRHFVCICRS